MYWQSWQNYNYAYYWLESFNQSKNTNLECTSAVPNYIAIHINICCHISKCAYHRCSKNL